MISWSDLGGEPKRLEPIPALIFGPFAIHKDVRTGRGFRVTHSETGYSLYPRPLKKRSTAMALAVAAMKVHPWSFKTIAGFKRIPKATRKKIVTALQRVLDRMEARS